MTDEGAWRNQLAADLSRVLNAAGPRHVVKLALASSPWREGKVDWDEFITGSGAAILEGIATLRGQDVQSLLAEIRSHDPLELYLPYAHHRSGWNGGAVLVGTIVAGEHDIRVYGPGAVPVPAFTRNTPPATPVLALVRREGRFRPRTQLPSAECDPELNPGCDEGPGGGGSSFVGLWLTEWQIDGDHEGGLSGNPEFEVTIVATSSPYQYGPSYTWRCAGEGFGQGHDRYWNYDDHDNYGSGQSLLLGSADLSGTAFSSALILVTENDDDSCDDVTNGFPSIGNPDPVENDDDEVGALFRSSYIPIIGASFDDVEYLSLEAIQF